MRPFIIAHRGFHATQPENSLAAFQAACRARCDGIEFDVRALRDGALVVHHDAHILDGPRRRRLRSFTLADLEGTSSSPRSPAPMEDVIRWARQHPETLLNVELKEQGILEGVAGRVRRTKNDVVLSSFLLDVALDAKHQAPRAKAVWIARRHDRVAVRRLLAGGVDGVALHQRAAAPVRIRRLRQAGLDVWLWAANDARVARRQWEAGAAAFITDAVPEFVRWRDSTALA